MRLPRIHRPRYADVAATLALLLAMGGTAYAATNLPAHSVGTKQLQSKAVTGSKIGPQAVTTPKLKNGDVTNAKLADGSVDYFKLAAGSVTHSKLGPNSIDGSNIAPNSLSLADIVGADANGAISFSVGADACKSLTLGVSGAVVGQAGLLTVTTGTLPAHIVIGPLQVTAANSMKLTACNVGGTSFSVSGLGVRVITFG